MKTKDEMKSVPSFDDLVFENRNKEYGAYKMRKRYNAALIWSMLVSVFFIGASVITPFVIEKGKPTIVVKPTEVPPVIFTNTQDLKDLINPDDPKPEAVKIKPPVYVAPEVVDSITKDDPNVLLTNEELDKTVKDENVTEEIQVIEATVDPVIDNNEPVDVVNVTEKPFFGTDGDNEFRRWIAQNVVYPQSAIDVGLQGRVYIQFVVEKDGTITNVKVSRSVDPLLDKEAIRVIESSPKWNPGKQQGTPVRVKFFFPITFSIK